MTEESLIAFLNMQYAFISNPIKKLQLLFFMNEIYEQRAEKILKERTQYTISLYLENRSKRKNKTPFKSIGFNLAYNCFRN